MRSSHGLGNRVAVYAFQGKATVAQLPNHPLLKSSGAIGPNQIEDDHYDEDRAEKRPAPPGATLLVRCVEAHALHDEYRCKYKQAGHERMRQVEMHKETFPF